MNNQKPPLFFLAEVLCVSILFGALYLFSLSKNFAVAHNAMSYIQAIDAGVFFDARHILYHWLAAQWLWLGQIFGLASDGILWIEGLNAVAGALAVTVFFVILRKRIGLGFFPALGATALPAFSYGLWLSSTTVEVIAIPLFFLMLLFYLLTRPRLGSWSCCWIGIVHGLAVLFYQLNGLFLLVALDVLLLQKNRLHIGRPRALCLYLVPLGLAVALPYGAVMLLKHSFQSWREASVWLLPYLPYAANPSEQWLRGLGLTTVAETALGIGHAIIGGHFLFKLPLVKHLLELKLAGKSLVGNAFIARALPVSASYPLLALTAAAGVTVFVGCFLALARRRGFLWRSSPAWRSGLIWLALYSIFAIIWDPSEVQFWTIQSVVFWLLLVILWCGGGQLPPRRQLAPSLAFFVLAACLAAVNYGGSIHWLSKSKNDYYQVKISPVIEKAAPGDLTIVLDPYIIDQYLEHYSKSDFIALMPFYEKNGGNALEKLLAIIGQRLAAGKQVFIMSDVLQDRPFNRDPALTSFVEEADRNLYERYARTWQALPTEAGTVYMLTGENQTTDTVLPQ